MDAFLAYTFSLYSAILVPFGTPDFGPKLATGLLALALAVFLCFLCFALPQAHRLGAALVAIRGKSNDETEHEKRTTFQDNYEAIDNALSSNETASNVWQEFRKTLIFRGSPQRTIILASTRPNNFFSPRSLRVQYDFVRSLPNYFVGLGLLGTFIGLIAALTFSTKSLTTAVDQEKIKEALNQLLTTAAAKFYISAAGLVASLILSLLIRLTLKHLHGRVHQINDALQERLLFVSEQNITEKQLSVQQESLVELRLFNTNIAMKIGDAVRSAVEASNDSLTNKLSEIAESFSRLIDASGAGAGAAVGEAMKGALDTSLRQAGDAIGNIAAELKDLPARLSAAATSIQAVGSAAAEQQEQLATKIQEAVQSSGGQKKEELLTEIDRSGYLGLEDFVRDRALLEGLDANLTKRSGDGGADIIVKDELGRIIYLIQCKHTSDIETPIDGGLLVDAQRVRANWLAQEATVIGISNARKFAPRIVDGFKKISGRLIAREQLVEFRLS